MLFEIPLQSTLIVGQTVWLIFRPIFLSGVHKEGCKIGIKLFAGDDIDLTGLRGVLGNEEFSEIAESRLRAPNGLLILLPAELCCSLILVWKRKNGTEKKQKQWVYMMFFLNWISSKRKELKISFTKGTGKHLQIPVTWLKSQFQFHKWHTIWHKTKWAPRDTEAQFCAWRFVKIIEIRDNLLFATKARWRIFCGSQCCVQGPDTGISPLRII